VLQLFGDKYVLKMGCIAVRNIAIIDFRGDIFCNSQIIFTRPVPPFKMDGTGLFILLQKGGKRKFDWRFQLVMISL
jgi:hypothetical protein